ncbi:MAG: hypothetical protein ACOX4G_06665 [Limnochordia bacterium]|jgi:hypothetical protein
MMNATSGVHAQAASGRPCSQARKAPSFAQALVCCQRCLKGTPEDYHACVCIGKLAYLHKEYHCATQHYLRAAALSLFRHLDQPGLRRLRKRTSIAPHRARQDAASILKEYEPTLLYHLGHARHATTTHNAEEYDTHLMHYTKGIRGLTPLAYDPSPNLLAHFHEEGLTALHQGGDFILTVVEQYSRFCE